MGDLEYLRLHGDCLDITKYYEDTLILYGSVYYTKDLTKVVGIDNTKVDIIVLSTVYEVESMQFMAEDESEGLDKLPSEHSRYEFFNRLETVLLPESVTFIGYEAFWSCKYLKEVQMFGVQKIGYNAFLDCINLDKVFVPDTVTDICHDAFCFCEKLEEIEIPDSVINIGKGAFAYCETLKEIRLPSKITSLEYNLLEGCEMLRTVEIPKRFQGDSSVIDMFRVDITYGIEDSRTLEDRMSKINIVYY